MVNIVGFGLMIGTAALLTWYRAMDRGTGRAALRSEVNPS
jgi:hypothetical protein